MQCPRKKVRWSGYLRSSGRGYSDVPQLELLHVWGSTSVRRYGKCAALRDQWVRHPFFDCSSKAARLGWIQSISLAVLLVPDADSTYHTAAAMLHLHYGRATYMVVLHLEYLAPYGLGSYMLLL